jgi:hypothetical protein
MRVLFIVFFGSCCCVFFGHGTGEAATVKRVVTE